MSQNDQLMIPDAAKKDSKSMELLRVWVANHEQHVTLRVGVWDDPAAWGVVLADLAGHVANSFAQGYAGHKGMNRAKALRQIADAFEAEMANPSEESTGEVIG